MGAFLASDASAFRWDIFLMAVLTTIFLQVLSNLANDYGDSIHGADNVNRKGPLRTVQSGVITPQQMRRMMILFTCLSLASGVILLVISFGTEWEAIVFFFGLGLLSIGAAVTYTVGRKPYGYMGLGDLSVLIFFGLIGVLGSFYLFTKTISWDVVLPAMSMGLLSVAVLNVNNIRDIDSDQVAGKYSIPVRLGRPKAVVYHWTLLALSVFFTALYTVLHYSSPWQLLFLLAIPLFALNAVAVQRKPSELLDPWLKQMAMSALLFSLLFGMGLILR